MNGVPCTVQYGRDKGGHRSFSIGARNMNNGGQSMLGVVKMA